MKVVVLKQSLIVDGIKRVEGEIITVRDSFSDDLSKRTLRKFVSVKEKRNKKNKLENKKNGNTNI